MATKRVEPTRKSTTNWKAFRSANVKVTNILCKAYTPVHLSDEGCHQRLTLKTDSVKSHINNNHGSQLGTAGFRISLRQGSRPDPLWQELEDGGIEVHDFRCDVCDKVLPLHNLHIINHMRPHAGKTRRVRQGGDFLFTLSTRPANPIDTELMDE